MNLKTNVCGISLLVTCAIAAATPPAATQPAHAPPEVTLPPLAGPAPAPATSPAVRDPTQADAALKQALAGAQAVGGPQRQLPQVTRRGLIIVAGKPPEALIEVQGSGIFFVREGSFLTASTNGVNTVLRVQRLTSDGIELTIDAQNVTIIVR